MARKGSFHENVRDYRRYARQIERLQSRSRGLGESEVSFSRLNFHRSNVARMLARVVAQGAYLSGAARRKTIVVDGKERVIFKYRGTDMIVHGAVADAIAEASAPFLSGQLYSYRKGIAWWHAVTDFAHYLREYRTQHPEPEQRHMYVLRRDIESYTDSIPVRDGAPVWQMLRELVQPSTGPSLPAADWQLVERVVRPEIEAGPGVGTVLLERGVPTGQPISCILFNFYLADLDKRLEAVPGAFYARYSDDILFAHSSPEAVGGVAAEIDAFLQKLGLRVKKSKSLDLYLTSAGRPSSAWPEATGTCTVPFMGARVRADGTVFLGRKKTRRFLRDVRDRADRIARSFSGADVDALGRTICASVNRMLEPDSALQVEARAAELLRRAVTDRRQLAQLDHWIARTVLRAVIGDGSVRAFRRIPLRKIRGNWGLMSLEHTRNQWGRRRHERAN